jgi:hypothetical protein
MMVMKQSSIADLYLCERVRMVDDDVEEKRKHDGYLGEMVVDILLWYWLASW